MDSGTSGGSMQSVSSGEDDQNDTSSFLTGVASIPRHHQHLDHHQHLLDQTRLHQPTFSSQQHFDHYQPLTSIPHLSSTNSSSYLETLPQSDLERIWSMSMNVNPHSHSSHHNQQHQQMFYSSTSSSHAPSSSAMNPSQNETTHQDPQPKPISKVVRSSTAQPCKENGSSSGRVVKKRTRASRKTPTTVLTTDTTNFRAMVQEFTGIPTPPFGPSSFFPTKKFDLFGTNNGLDHPSLGSLLFSLNKSTNNTNPNPNPNPFAPSSITTTSQINTFASERNQSSNLNLYKQQSQQMMLPQGSNSTFLNLPQSSDHIKNPIMTFHQSLTPHCPPFPSKFLNSGNDVDDQIGAFSNVERGENDNASRTG